MANQDRQVLLLATNQLRHGMSHEFEIDLPEPVAGFVLNWFDQFHAYRNACPHTGVTLNWAPHQFLDIEGQLIQCGMHGALFEPVTGLCIRGPCLGQSLTRLPIRVIEGDIYLVLAGK